MIFAADTKTLAASKAQIPKTLSRLSNSGLGLDVTVLQDEQCSYGVVEHFGDYGLVIMDTHGTNNSFLVGSTLDLSGAPKSDDALKSLINTQAGAGTSDKILSGSLKLVTTVKANINTKNWQKSLIPQGGRELFFTTKYLDLLPPMPNTIILGICAIAVSALLRIWLLFGELILFS